MRARAAAFAVAIGTVLALVAAPVARAAPLQISFEGVISDFEDPDGVLDGSVGVGTPFSGSVSFDSSAADSNPSPNEGEFAFALPPYALAFAVGNYALVPSAELGVSTVSVLPFPGDAVIFAPRGGASVSGPLSLPVDGVTFNFRYDDPNGTTLSSTDLADVPFALASWPRVSVLFGIDVLFDPDLGDINSAFMGGAVTSLSIVPEASALVLLVASGLVLWVGWTRPTPGA